MSEYKDRWIAALRSGKYEQGPSALCIEDDTGVRHYCCLGVLAHLDGVLTQERETHISELGYTGVKQFGWLEGYGPNEVMYSGVNRVLDRILIEPPEDIGDEEERGDDLWSLTYVVANLNDKGWTFERIADYLETVDF